MRLKVENLQEYNLTDYSTEEIQGAATYTVRPNDRIMLYKHGERLYKTWISPQYPIKGYYEDIIESKPGITGLWQVSGRSNTTFEERMEFDLEYNENKSNLNKEYNYLLNRKPIIDQFILSTDDIVRYSLYNIENIDMNKVSELFNNRYNLLSYFIKNS